MKKLFIIIVTLLMLNGCVSSAVKEQLRANAAKLDGYVKLMDADHTTPQENEDLIRAMRIWTWEMNQLTNGELPPEDIRLIVEARLRARGED